MNIAIIGGGVSGITYAAVLTRLGHDVTLYEKEGRIAGVWAKAYPEVRLQNISSQYFLSDFPWRDKPDLHPTGEQIRAYIDQAVERFKLEPRLNTEVLRLEERDHQQGWTVHYRGPHGEASEDFDYAIVATGQYTQPKASEIMPGTEDFEGELVSERSLISLETFRSKRVVVIGFGKTALDLAVFAARRDATVQHVFRTARWLLPTKLFGMFHYTHALFSRFGSVLVPCWAHPTFAERMLHTVGRPFVRSFWWLLSRGLWRQFRSNARGLGADAKRRIATVKPRHPLLLDMRSAAAVAPDDYFRLIAEGKVEPVRAEVAKVVPDGVELADGRRLGADVLVLATGASTPRFPFLPASYRSLLEASPDGVQLYRHIIHPRIPNLAFAGYNHGFLHIPAAEVGALWLDAVMNGRLELPPVDRMESTMAHIAKWKADNIAFEPSRSCAVNTRFQQYLDILLAELRLSRYRKLPNVFAEIFGRYGPADYAGLLAEYQKRRKKRPLRSLGLPT